MDKKANPKSFWKFVRSKTTTRTGIGNLKDENDNTVTNDKDKAEIFKAYFSSVFTIENDNIPSLEKFSHNTLCEIVVTIDKVRQLLMSVNSSKSAFPDKIHPRFIKELAHELALPVYILFNKSLSEGDLAQIWKMAHVSCIFKSGDRTKACNYRPISLTSLFCWLLEKSNTICYDVFLFRKSYFKQLSIWIYG